ncbi:hypothetical protein D3C81_2026000 [compost metagenome]
MASCQPQVLTARVGAEAAIHRSTLVVVSFYWKLLEAMSAPQVIANFNAHIHYQERQLKELDKLSDSA